MAFLIKNVQVFSPNYLGRQDLLTVGDRLVAIEDKLTVDLPDLTVIDGSKLIATPGLMDQHVHITGGGGEGGPKTRCPELQLSELIDCGTTSVVGVLGTDGISRSPIELLAKVRALQAEGISAWMHTSSYLLPPQTITGSVRNDLYAIPEVLGVKIAIGDHRSSYPSVDTVLTLLTDIRVAAMLAGKIGFLHIHLGDVPGAFDLFEAIRNRNFPMKHIRPMHIARDKKLFDEACEFALKGGYVDVTSAGICAFDQQADAIKLLFERNIPNHLITMSTDGHGSKPRFNDRGDLIGLRCGGVAGNLDVSVQLIREGYCPETVLPLVTSNVATALGLPQKGVLGKGKDADLCLFDEEWNLKWVFAQGELMKDPEGIKRKGTFEE